MLKTWRAPETKAPAVLRLALGQGRDFTMGDRHGVNLVMRALLGLCFNPDLDRLFSVGDLVDRGDDSQGALELLNNQWFYAVLGNHELMLLDLYKTGTLNEAMLRFHVARNGMGWWLDTPDEIQAAILDAFSRLPIVMEVETARGKVGIIHAEVPRGMDWPTFIARVEAGDPDAIRSALWGRERVEHHDTSGVPGIDRVFAGHTPQFEGLLRLGNCYFIDTGAVFGQKGVAPGKLTVANLTCQTIVLESQKPAVLPLIDLFAEEGSGPFGQYATVATKRRFW